MTEQQQLEAAIAALEGQRSTLGDAVVDALLSAARARLAALTVSAASPSVPAQALRQVSILFLDVVGSTALAQHLDPEAISAVMDDALARGTAVVQAHAGKVLQYAGDSILAAFGADEAREDDAERAVRCGLALLDLGKAARRRSAGGARPRRLRRPRRRPHRRRAARRRGGCRRQHSRHRGEHRRAHGADGADRGLAHQPRRLRPGARPVRGRAAGGAGGQGRGRADPELPGAARQVEALSPRQPRHRRRGDADDRPRRRARGASGRLQAAVRRSPSRRRQRGGRCRHRQEPPALRVRSLERRPPGALLPLPRPRHAADPRPAVRPAARHRRLALADRRRRQHRGGAQQDGAGPGAAVPGRRRPRPGRRPCPSARPPDRHRVAREPPRQGHPRRPQADPQPRLPRRGAAVPPHRPGRRMRRSCCCSKTCTGPTTRAWTSSPTWRKSTATCRC